MEWFVNIMYTGLCPPRDTSLEVFFPALLPFPLLPPFLAQSVLRSLPPSHLSLALSMRRSVTSSTHPPSTLPSSIDALSLPSIIASSLPPLDPSLPPHPHLAPSRPPPCLHACRHLNQWTQCVLFGQLH